ncbi:hypothetical protein ACQP1O_15215 [Nocardia sp. CA-151230]|uniref:hypothetical protein n=1 Tax=Nocardia sp. CA-151230 TaxID=3239982 RepID=UPI003D8D4B1A
MAALLPGWIERGNVWPTELAEQAAVDGFVPMTHNTALLGSLPDEFPSLHWATDWTIPSVATPRRYWSLHYGTGCPTNAEQLTAVGDRWNDRPYVRTALRKMDEALALAELTGTGFVEAAEIYLPMQGIID